MMETSCKKGEIPKTKKHEKELGRTDPRFGISRSNSPHPQILVPNGPLYPHFWSHQSFTLFNGFSRFQLISSMITYEN